jgi:alkylhydroperoxidase family enzyme
MSHDQDAELAARQALVAGHPPRIPPLEIGQLSEETLGVLAGFIALNETFVSREPDQVASLKSAHAAGTAAVGAEALEKALSPVIRTMLRHPHLFARHIDVSTELFRAAALPARARELAVLRVAWLCRAPFEWGEHVHIAKQMGVLPEEIERITEGSAAPGWGELDRALLRAVEELLADAFISDPTWATLRAHYDEQQLIELLMAVGQYQTVAYYQNSLRVTLNEGNPGLSAR